MKKYIKQVKKQAVGILLVAVVVSVFMPVQALANTQSWQRAYAEFLHGYRQSATFPADIWEWETNRMELRFSIRNVDGGGIPELIVLFDNQAWHETASFYYRVYEYSNGTVRLVSTHGFFDENAEIMTTYPINPANIATHIYGVTANANSHPFAVELQNIINNLPTGHTLSATLINLDERGEQQGVAILTHQYYPIDSTTIRILYMHNERMLVYTPADMASEVMAFELSQHNMLVFSYGGGEFTVEFNNGAIQRHTFYSINNTRPLLDQTPQILAMQAAAAPTTPTPQPTPTINVTLNGVPINFEVPPQNVDGRTLVPLRAIFEAMGATIDWNGGTQTVTAIRGNDTVVLQVGNHTMTRNGQSITLDVPPRIMEGRTFVPARAVAEAFGAVVGWDNATRTVTIITQ
jgi:hypothetical protein